MSEKLSRRKLTCLRAEQTLDQPGLSRPSGNGHAMLLSLWLHPILLRSDLSGIVAQADLSDPGSHRARGRSQPVCVCWK